MKATNHGAILCTPSLREIDGFNPRLVALAGFMRVLTPGFVEHYRNRLLNIHPSLLPAFPGLDTHERALAAGVKLHGCTVHVVTAELDRRYPDRPKMRPTDPAGFREGWDVVAGSRYMRGGRIVGQTTKQRISHLYSILCRLAGGPRIHDVSNAFKAYRRAVVESVSTVADSFDVSVELTLKAHLAGFRVGEIPTVWTNRREGRSNFAMRTELRNYGRWLLLALRRRPPASAPLTAEAPAGERP